MGKTHSSTPGFGNAPIFPSRDSFLKPLFSPLWRDGSAFLLRHRCGWGWSLTFASLVFVLSSWFLAFSPVRVVAAAPQVNETPPGAESGWTTIDENALASGWIQLFDGSTLAGWKPGSEADWRVENGAIRVSAGLPGLLCTTSQFSDFELQFEVLAGKETNSGVFLRTSPVPTSPVGDCYELNIIRPELHQYATGSLVGRAVANTGAHPDGENWLRIRARVEGGFFRVWVNDAMALEYDEEDLINGIDPSGLNDATEQAGGTAAQPVRLGRGYIGLQFKEGPVAFRNIALKPLGLEEQVGADWDSHWDAGRTGAAKAEWSPEEQVLRLLGGSGQLESKPSWGDFVVQARIRTDAAGVNSGLFYRCVPGSNMDGYEIQIDHTAVSPDDPSPANGGTGAIFRRTNVQRLLSRDNEWFVLTAAFCGPHVSVWINGRLVTDWTDTRPADPNPRKGLRLEPGTLMLQGHDPDSAISVETFLVSELRPRRIHHQP